MGEFSGPLSIHRDRLNDHLEYGGDHVQRNWKVVEPLLNCWWTAYKAWEANDNFNKAFRGRRMTVRTFPGGIGAFEKQVSKEFKRGSISLASSTSAGTEVRIFADSRYTPLDPVTMRQHDEIFHKTEEHLKYRAMRGINSSAFAKPSNFATREKKYEEGLHDLSASLLNPDLSIFDQIHNTDVGGKLNYQGKEIEGAHFSFLPLSMEEDQLVLYRLIQCAKACRHALPELYTKVRDYRARMTRVKLANEFDMGIGYSAVPVANPPRGGPAYKLRYGLGKQTTITGQGGQQTVPVTAELYAARQQAALRFKRILGIRDAKNEVIIAIRKHKGPFPVYAVRSGNELLCYEIVGDQMRLNAKKISSAGVMTGG